MRLDLRVAREHSLSRRRARDYVETGRVDVDGTACREPGRDVPESARVTLDVNRPAVGNVRTKLAVLHEDPHIVVVDKPAGLLTLPTEAHEKDTLLSRVNAYLQHRYRKRPYVGVVHRLDKETSGAVVFARSRETLRGLQELFRRHDVEREYVAIIEGSVAKDSGTIGLDLVRDAGDRRRGTARRGETGLRAVTHYRVLRRMRAATLVALRLETGRTHQIRVHLAAIGHPVVGDAVYRPERLPGPPLEARRQMLHARTLGFRHPQTGDRILVESEPPADFRERLESLSREPARRPPAPPPRGNRVGSAIERSEGRERRDRRRPGRAPADFRKSEGAARRAGTGNSVAESAAEVSDVGIRPVGSPRNHPARGPRANAAGETKGGAPPQARFPPEGRIGRPSGAPPAPFGAGVEGRRRDRRRRGR